MSYPSHYHDFTSAWWYLESLATRLFVQKFVLVKDKEILMFRIIGHLWAESTFDPKKSNEIYLYDNVIITFPMWHRISVFVCLRWLYHQILTAISYICWESWVFVPISTLQCMMCTNNRLHYGLKVVFVCLHITLSHYHHRRNMSEGIEYINACQVYSVECVCV